VGGALVVASPAYADNIGTMPSGCGISPSTPSILVAMGYRYVTFGGSAHCAGATSIAFRLVHDYSGLPDVRVAEVTLPYSDTSYSGHTCDNGGTTKYYSEIAFNGLSTTVQRVSSSVTLSHC
jgi:hypothetical protein